ncbi:MULTISPECIES: polysaccharide deacetylase family protein [unclassified Paenibacillus]|uniref:polysaccharide deacetylase family protein n=1 Tax=unclassified Paenibacillus TaxID=185978 RepID=UPI000423C9F5|nr:MULTISPECIES: polysaccharide deacetylase family protein [unclassified Paenibacillus]KGP78977.1 xylanase deacetylase [Paenibacillus sp. MAEPY2]KGP88276.1 xylanase deacetylase [Paenibacillus sp. MAEPY1]MDN8588707.1 polysaccharide deacetylase family protein [Paenibacillus sp. 11B]OPG94527.1 polysaccharide deacetylase family protein [Chryseobacterium mucoviscidosis]
MTNLLQSILLWLLYISSFYAFIPSLVSRLFGFRVFRRGRSEKEFSLTFDDGPDPEYTPRLLDLLRQYEAKATFFVVGEHAARHPELIQRIHEEGHLLGIHNYIHKTNWLMRPRTVRDQIQRTGQIIQEVTGVRTCYYRPPWGIMNLFDFFSKKDRRIILWSSMFEDWRSSVGVEKLTERMLKELRGGEVMLLHDRGTTLGADAHAPEQMLQALEVVLQEADRQRLHSVRIDTLMGGVTVSEPKSTSQPQTHLSFWKRMVVALWLGWEKLFHWVYHLRTASPEDPLLHYRSRVYHGALVEMNDGHVIRNGDPVIELHFDNKKLFDLGMTSRSSMHLAIRMIRAMEQQLPDLARQVTLEPELRSAKALYGVSMINRGPEKFGFTVRELAPGPFSSASKVYLKLLLSVIHPAGTKRLKQRSEQLVPKMIAMPLDVLLDRYGQHALVAATAEQSSEELLVPEQDLVPEHN